MNNPFVYGKEVSGYQFYDRTKMLAVALCLVGLSAGFKAGGVQVKMTVGR